MLCRRRLLDGVRKGGLKKKSKPILDLRFQVHLIPICPGAFLKLPIGHVSMLSGTLDQYVRSLPNTSCHVDWFHCSARDAGGVDPVCHGAAELGHRVQDATTCNKSMLYTKADVHGYCCCWCWYGL